jgi:hypothetical protein
MAYIGKIPAAAALTASDLADGIITEAKMADDAISLTELKAGTDGEIISWDASGNPVAIGAGTSGHFLKSQGAGSQPVFAAAASGSTTPYFSAELSSDQTLTDGTYTKIAFNTELADSDTAYDNSSNYRFTVPSGEGGKYFLWTSITTGTSLSGTGVGDLWKSRIAIYKNGSAIQNDWFTIKNASNATKFARSNHNLMTIQNLSASDYIECFVLCDIEDSSYTIYAFGSNQSQFGGFKLID